jgi:hypothetical protein
MAKLNCIRGHLAFGVQVDKFEAAVGVQGRTNVEAILGPKVPQAPMNQPFYREVRVHFKRVGDIEVVKRSVKSYVTILSG